MHRLQSACSRKLLIVAATACVAAAARAQPIATPGTQGHSVVASGEVFATSQDMTASFRDDLFLNGVFVFNNPTMPVGTTVGPGTFAAFAANTERIFSFDTTVGVPAPSSVPEPKTWALMAAGLGMAGLIARRRRDAIDRLRP